jgi:hypothetical protein
MCNLARKDAVPEKSSHKITNLPASKLALQAGTLKFTKIN